MSLPPLRRPLLFVLVASLSCFLVSCASWPGMVIKLDVSRFPSLVLDFAMAAPTPLNPLSLVTNTSPKPDLPPTNYPAPPH